MTEKKTVIHVKRERQRFQRHVRSHMTLLQFVEKERTATFATVAAGPSSDPSEMGYGEFLEGRAVPIF